MQLKNILVLGLLFITSVFTSVEKETSLIITSIIEKKELPIAKVSWYGGFFHGRTTANGEKYNMNALTAAHKKLPFNTKVKITNLTNGKSVVVRINDRGPYVKGRLFDLSKGAFSSIEDIDEGIISVSYEILSE